MQHKQQAKCSNRGASNKKKKPFWCSYHYAGWYMGHQLNSNGAARRDMWQTHIHVNRNNTSAKNVIAALACLFVTISTAKVVI